MPTYATCHCGARWQQIGNQTGHCGGCHETFASLGAFDAHFRGLSCVDPATMVRSTGEALYVAEYGGPQVSNGIIWRLVPTPKQQAALDRLRDRKLANA